MIPGHGGVMDRFDCQTLMGIFVTVYYNSFVRCAVHLRFSFSLQS